MDTKAGRARLIFRIRAVLLLLLTTSIFLPSLYQPLLTALWAFLRENALYRSSTFETFWTVLCYAAIEVPLTIAFIKHPEWRLPAAAADAGERRAKPKGMRRPSRRAAEALVYMAPLLLLDLTMIKKFAGVTREAQLRSGNYDPALASAYHQPTALLPSLHNFTRASPLQTQRALPPGAPSSRRVALELAGSVLLYDAGFFAFHAALHAAPALAAWHAPHHAHAAMHPQLTNRLHVAERLGLVLLANGALHAVRAHVLTRTLFVPAFVWLLVEIHCGMAVPWAYDAVLPPGWAGGARKHAAHHATGAGGYAPYFEWCDAAYDWLRTRWKRRAGSSVVRIK